MMMRLGSLLLAAMAGGQSLSPTGAPAAVPPRLYAVRLSTGPAWDAAKSPTDQAGMKEHSANIARLRRDGTLVLGARFGEIGLLVLRCPDEASVRKQLDPDPAVASGVFKVQIDAFAPFAHGTTAWLATEEAVALRAYFEAYNRHETESAAALLSPKVKWWLLAADKLNTEAKGRAALRARLAVLFRARTDARSDLLSIEQAGAFLSARQRASWTADGILRVEQSHCVYEIRGGLIERVWCSPAVPEREATRR